MLARSCGKVKHASPHFAQKVRTFDKRFTKHSFHNCGFRLIFKKLFTLSTGFSTGCSVEITLSKFVRLTFYLYFRNFFRLFIPDFRFYIKCLCNIFMHTPFYVKKCGRDSLFRTFSQGFTQYGFGSVCVQAHIRHISRLVFIVGLGTDHGPIVAAELQWRHIDLRP